MLSLIRVSKPPTLSERLLLAAVRQLNLLHAVVPHKCKSVELWLAPHAPHKQKRERLCLKNNPGGGYPAFDSRSVNDWMTNAFANFAVTA